jgi:hypothetical protein
MIFFAPGSYFSILKMPKSLDPFWEYGEPVNPRNRQILSCNLCGEKMTGGVYRLKYHLAKISGHEVGICPNSSPELVVKATKALEEYAENKKYTEAKKKEMASRSKSSTHTLGVVGVGSSEIHSSQSVMPIATSPFFVPRSTSGAQPSIGSMLKIKEKEADKIVGRCLLWSDIPFNFAKNPFYVSMFEVVTIVGPEYKPPTYEELRGPILQNEKVDCTQRL